MTSVTVQPDSMLAALPARYSKFITVLVGLFITYVSIYGWAWHLEPALIMIGTALGVYGVPNGQQPIVVQTPPIPALPPVPAPAPAPAARPAPAKAAPPTSAR